MKYYSGYAEPRNPVPIQKTSPSYSNEHFHFQFIRTMKKLYTTCNKSMNIFKALLQCSINSFLALTFKIENDLYTVQSKERQQVEIN